jgi:hypothetical protein
MTKLMKTARIPPRRLTTGTQTTRAMMNDENESIHHDQKKKGMGMYMLKKRKRACNL